MKHRQDFHFELADQAVLSVGDTYHWILHQRTERRIELGAPVRWGQVAAMAPD
jgi:hypothetical protein